MNALPVGRAESVGPTMRIAEWVASLSSERTAAVQEQAIEGVRDLIGCMIGGCIEPAARQAAAVASKWGAGRTSIVGNVETVTAPSAAFANGTAAHVLDFDDSFAPLTGHPSAPLVPAILALAEEQGSSGAAVLDAYVTGIEVIATVARSVNPSHYNAGWHSTAIVGLIGAAAACARLLKLDAAGIGAAISIAVSSSSGSRMQIGFPMKSVQVGFAARDAVIAAMLAAEGMRGNPEALIGPRSFSDLYSNARPTADAFVLPEADAPLAIADPGITFKPYPTCGSTHRSLDALLDLRKEHGFAANDVESVEIVIPALNVNNLVYDNPASGMEARFSMPYCAALAILQGALRLSDFDDGSVSRPDVQSLMRRVTMRPLPGSENTSKDYLELPAHTIVRLKSGAVLEDARYGRRGAADSPMSRPEHAAKFLDCATRAFSDSLSEQLLELITNLASAPTIDEFMSVLRSASRENTVS